MLYQIALVQQQGALDARTLRSNQEPCDLKCFKLGLCNGENQRKVVNIGNPGIGRLGSPGQNSADKRTAVLPVYAYNLNTVSNQNIAAFLPE